MDFIVALKTLLFGIMGTQSLERLVLEGVEERGSIETFEFAKELGKDHQSIVGSVKSIHALGDVSVFLVQWGYFIGNLMRKISVNGVFSGDFKGDKC